MILIVTFVTGMIFYPIFALFPAFLGNVYDGADLVQIGVDSIPLGTGNVFGGLTVGFLLPYLGPKIGTTPFLAIGPVLQLLFLPMLCLSRVDSKAIPLAFSFLGAAGLGVIELLTILLVQLAAPDKWIGFACGSLALMRSLGGAAGNAIFQTVLQSKAAQFIPEAVAASALSAGLPASSLQEFILILTGTLTTTPVTAVPGVNADIITQSTLAMKNAYLRAFRYIWYAAIPFMFIGLVASLACKDLSSELVKHRAQRLKFENYDLRDDKADEEIGKETPEEVHNRTSNDTEATKPSERA